MAINWTTERRKVKDLRDNPKNPRTFTEKGMVDLKASINSIGYVDPIAINQDGTILGGHARRKTLLEIGIEEVDVRVPDRLLTPKQVKEALVRLNKNVAGEFNQQMLMDEFEQEELIDWGFQRSDFNSFAKKGKTDEDEIPELPAAPISAPGDIWVLGNHRLACGSATDAAAVEALLAGARPMLMVTDPPYGVNYDPTWRDGKGAYADPKQRGKVENDDRVDWSEAWALFPGDVAYVWHGGLHTTEVANTLAAYDFEMRAQIVWVKQHFVFGRGHFHWQHEPCWYAVRKGKKANWVGGRKQTTVWEIANHNPMGGNNSEEKTGHGTQKPVECMKRPIQNNSNVGEAVYEPFSGSGTTIIAAEVTDRHCYAMELNPAYVDMAVIRWQNFTGKKAVHAVTGDHFVEPNKMVA